ncbi:helix-turn-helix transcriptional regulator [Polyangium spumosum]|uniref:Helix-turn-helix domain-containing protein n=1 Tax=Polyangium spumosum TaxID=889282 RepID=A0A6N7Q1C5_9BACT|nr:helix-turn-helix transcriptional regulator [Polyangium spumosum]MRG98282.1 helix-turn-helix domain-containing protein [Polyangium spumosum]
MPRRKAVQPLLRPLGDRIRELRLNRKMSLAKLADTSGVSKGSLSSIENGRINLTVETCVKIAVGLGVRVQDVIPSGLEALLSRGRESDPGSHVKRAG